jgi:hypothetical protein
MQLGSTWQHELMDASPKFQSFAARTFPRAPYWSRSTIQKQKNQALAAEVLAEAQLAHIDAGTRAEEIAARKAVPDRAEAAEVLAQKTYDRVKPLAERRRLPAVLFGRFA